MTTQPGATCCTALRLGLSDEIERLMRLGGKEQTDDNKKKRVEGVIPITFKPLLTTPDARKLLQNRKFPEHIRIIPQRTLLATIASMLADKVTEDRKFLSEGLKRPECEPHMYDFFLRKYGLVALAEQYLVQFLASLADHRKREPRAQLIGRFCGMWEPLPTAAMSDCVDLLGAITVDQPATVHDLALVHNKKGVEKERATEMWCSLERAGASFILYFNTARGT